LYESEEDQFYNLLSVNSDNEWSIEELPFGTGGGGGGYEPPVGGIPKSDLASDVQASLDLADSALQSQTQANWTQTNTSADDYIKNKPTLATVATSGSYNDLSNKPTIPTKVSDLTNDSGFTSNAGTITGITMNGVSKGTSGVVNLGTVITAHQDISGKANASDVYTKTQTDTLLSGKQDTLTFDNEPTDYSPNPVTSGGIKHAIDNAEINVVDKTLYTAIVANLTTDSDSDVLSASMGVALKALIDAISLPVSESGLYFVDSNNNIGAYFDATGFHAINILEHVIT
jgi:hypothetical protein